MTSSLKRLDDGLWIADQLLKYLGVEMGSRMTIVEIADSDELAVISPIRPTEFLVEQIRQIGTVTSIIAPNLLHHLFVQDFKNEFPDARLYGPEGLKKKRVDLNLDDTFEESKTYPWSTTLTHHLVQGFPKGDECVFFVPHLKTLIVTDLGFHICQNKPFLTRVFFKALGHFGKFGWSSLEKKLYIKNKEAFAKSILKISDWDFEKIIMAHGRPILENGSRVFKDAF